MSTSTCVSTTKIANAIVTIAIERLLDMAVVKEETLIFTDVPPLDAARWQEDDAA
jgi:hypothetical protein